ncbi:glycoside hydrolase family 2 TIM barrel-domain containing protein [Paenibacillus tepidiphilus]|uniref:glycoside hydrolase family 2 TIM barrel-domain containing protein n=1 Tax=Paenibacillus tepidiphilus TaxID=2608683 RepID=UPI0013A5B660|nr:glycoside hydrolase family 2 TIM barrel-domain containing protein [Paenibacillus tepidiphilus]
MRETISMDKGWKFHLGDFTEPRNRWAWGKSGSWNQGPESFGFDDSAWREVSVPHDFVIEGEPQPYMVKEFDDKDNAIPEMQSVNNMHTTAGSLVKNVGWYRKRFYIPEEDKGKKLVFIFDGVYRDSSIFVNNFFVQKHLSGYTGIHCDITDFVNYGGDNVISVRADARGAEGWFYEGGGIYRHTYLLKTAPAHIEHVFVACEVDPYQLSARIKVKTELDNGQSARIRLVTEIINPDGDSVGAMETELSGECAEQEVLLSGVSLWDLDNPHMYKAVCRAYSGDELTDEYTTGFGIREIKFTGDEGFFLNGKSVKIKGVCAHQNHGGLGTALPDEIYTFRIRKLKEMGCNAYRTSHYPPTPELLDVCDRLGMLVMDETRLLSSAKEDLAQLEFMVKRDRNHPSVIMYSIGNEEAQSQTTPQGARIAGTMMELIRKLDPTRPVTMGLLMWDLANKRPIEDISDIAGISEQLDIAGFNYQDHRWQEYHERYLEQPMICTEQGTFKSTRGCYTTEAEKGHLAVTDKTESSYMKGARQWRAAKPPYMSGLFLWTGFDYYGEPSPYAWPATSSQFGIMDLCGYPKDFYYYYKAWWTDEEVLHVFPHWDGQPGELKDVHVFANFDEVELAVNGRSLCIKKMETDDYLEWEQVAYEPGELRARGYRDGVLLKETVISTTGSPYRVVLSLDFAENQIAVIKAEVQDDQGRRVPDAGNELSFMLEGEVELLGTSNGDPSDHTLAHSRVRRAFNGLAQAIVRFSGRVVVTVQSDGLEGNELFIE